MDKRKVIIVLLVVIVLSLLAAGFMSPRKMLRSKSPNNAQIAVITIDGAISGSQNGFMTDGASAEVIMKQLRQAKDDPNLRAVLLRINSPGGTVGASQEIGVEVKKLRQAGKIVVTSMGDVTASGGYWIAATTDKIVANPGTMTGSIGVIMPVSNWEQLYQKIGIRQDPIKSGPHKDMGSAARTLTPEERQILQTMVDDMYNQFVTVVAEGRNMDPAKVRSLADGRIFTGQQAKELGLVDELGNYYDALDIAKQMAGISGKVPVKEFGKPSPLEYLLGGMETRLSRWLTAAVPGGDRMGAVTTPLPESR